MTGPVLLRGKIALITACVVALAIAGISVVTWLVTEHNLRSQLDKSLLASLPPRMGRPSEPGEHRALKIICDEGLPNEGLQQVLQGIQTLSTAGRTCAPPGVDPVVTSAADFVQTTTYRDGVTKSGTSARVLLQPLDNGDVLILSRSLAEIDDTLTALAGVLVSVSIFGTLLVAGLGLWLTRRALTPMKHLTETVEHIARTEDLTTPVTVAGQDEVGRLGRAFTSMTAALAESRRRQRDLVNDAAHELRTPLTSLRTNIDLLVRAERTGRELPQRAEVLDRLQAQSQEFSDLVTELVVLARDDRELASDPVDVSAVIDRAVERARSRAHDHVFDVDHAGWSIVGDAGALERSVLNLLDNAVKFSPASSTITVRSRPGWLTVSDEGPGVPFEHRRSAFERFWRAPDARGLPGSGLGLAIVADVVAVHGGSVRFVPRPRGASVRVDLPEFR